MTVAGFARAAGGFAALLSLAVAGGPGCGDRAVSATPAKFEEAACPTSPVPAPAGARCGYLEVPETRGAADGRRIRLLVAIVPSVSQPAAPDPVVYLTGGPGGIAILEAPILVAAGLNRDRDLVLMNQRGTLYAEPALTCPEIDRFFVRNLGLVLDAPSTRREHAAAAGECHRRLAAQGVDFGAYDTTASAADFADLRTALGIAEWNVVGVSYGTNLALTLMREHPQGIRSVTLDSVEPPSAVDVGAFWGNAREGFDALFGACAAQPGCWSREPGLAETFDGLVRDLEARPVTARVTPVAGGSPIDVVLDGGALVNWLVDMAFAAPDYPHVPAWIAELADGRPEKIAVSRAAPVLATPEGYIGYGLTYGVICREWVPYESESDVLRQGRLAFPGYPDSVLAPAVHFTHVYADCAQWPVPRGPAVQRAVTRSAIPTLLLAGGFDGVTPASWARLAAATLPNSTVVVIPGGGHFVSSTSSCAQRVIASFLARPGAPDTGCVAELAPPVFDPA